MHRNSTAEEAKGGQNCNRMEPPLPLEQQEDAAKVEEEGDPENASGAVLSLAFLPSDVLFLIFRHCDTRTLGRLCQVCRRFNLLASRDFLWVGLARTQPITNQVSALFQNRSSCLLSAKEKCRVSWNWQRGKYEEVTLMSHRTRYMPWLQLTSDRVWVSKGRTILSLDRRHILPHTRSMAFRSQRRRARLALRGHSDDVCRFVLRGQVVASGGRDGCLCCWDARSGRFLFCRPACHTSDVDCVDLYGSTLVSGSRDETVKVWNILEDSPDPMASINVGDRVWSLLIDPTGTLLCTGSSGHHQVPPLQLYDLGSGRHLTSLGSTHREGAGVLDMVWESPSSALSCGYDTQVRMWDVRSPAQPCLSWEDPHDAAIYCLATDRLYSIVSGTARHGRVQLWDKRQPRRSLQMYYATSNHSSPVYSLAFDACVLYVALDQAVKALDFRGYDNQVYGYL